LEELDSDGICRLIYILYRVLFFDWLTKRPNGDPTIVSIVVHCIQVSFVGLFVGLYVGLFVGLFWNAPSPFPLEK
jgi:hypothetical protein